MKTKRTLIAALLCATMALTVGCGGQSSANKTSSTTASAKASSTAASTTSTVSSSKASSTASAAKSTASNAAADEVDGVSLANPIKIDKEAKTVTVLCSVNGQYLHSQPDTHLYLRMAVTVQSQYSQLMALPLISMMHSLQSVQKKAAT